MAIMKKTMGDVRRGDIIRFTSYALRVEKDPERRGNMVRVEGRESRDGCAYVRRQYFAGLPCVVETEEVQA